MSDHLKQDNEMSLFERVGEKLLWNTRYIVLLAVIFSIIASVSLFIIGSYEIVHSLIYENPIWSKDFKHNHSQILYKIISAVDLYLIGVVLMIFGFGIYELFISKIDIARRNKNITILEIESLDELKNKIVKVIVMVLIVSFFERILKNSDEFKTALNLFYFAVSIFAIAFSIYYINKNKG